MMAEINLEAMERAVNAEKIGGYRTMPVSVEVMERLLSYARDLEADRDSWRDQASQRLKDWDVMRVRAETAEQRIRELEQDAARYRLLRRGQHWSVIDGIGNSLRAEILDATIDAARGAKHG